MHENDGPDTPSAQPPRHSRTPIQGEPAQTEGSPRRRARLIPWILASVGLIATLGLLTMQLGTASDLRRTEKDLEDARAAVKSLRSKVAELSTKHEEARVELREMSRDLDDASSKRRELGKDLRACRSFFKAGFRAALRLGPAATNEEIGRAIGPKGRMHLVTCLGGEFPFGGGGSAEV